MQDISVQGKNIIDNLDIYAESGGMLRGLVRTIHDVPLENVLQLHLRASKGKPLLRGIEVVRTE